MQNNPLGTASDLIAQFGPQAEMLAGDQIEAALLSKNEDDFRYWSLVANAITLLTRQAPAGSVKALPEADLRPTADDTPVRIARRAAS